MKPKEKVIRVNFNKIKNQQVYYELTQQQKYELALIELVYNIKPYKYEQIFTYTSARDFISRHKDYIDHNIIIEKFSDGNSYVCDKEYNFYGIIYKGSNDGLWNNTYYIKNEMLDLDPKEAEDIYYAVTLCERNKEFSLYKVLEQLNNWDIKITENTYDNVEKLVNKMTNKIPIGEYINSLDKSVPMYNPF